MKLNRRKALILTAGGLVAPLGILKHRSAVANEPLDPSDPAAVSLGYATKSEVAEQNCANCQLYVAIGSGETGSCAIFPNKVVAAKAWCKAWVKRAS